MGVAQECQGVVHAPQAKERVEGADGETVASPWIHTAHVSNDPFDALALFLASFDHPAGDLHGGNVVTCCGERDGDASRARAPLDYRSGFAFGEVKPGRQVVVVGIFKVVQVG